MLSLRSVKLRAACLLAQLLMALSAAFETLLPAQGKILACLLACSIPQSLKKSHSAMDLRLLSLLCISPLPQQRIYIIC